MDIGRSLTFYTEDPRWKEKLGMGIGVILISSLLSFVLVGILGFAILMGYSVRLLQNVRDGVEYPLPEWDQWGDDLARGFKLFVVTLIWALPIFVAVIPTILGSALADSGGGGGEFIGVMLILCGTCLSVVYGLVLLVLTPGISVLFAEDEQISSGLKIREIWQWTRERIGEVLIVTVLVIAVGFVLSLVAPLGVILCVVGLLVTLPASVLLTYLIQYHLYGQLARSGQKAAPAAATYTAPVAPVEQVDPFAAFDEIADEAVEEVADDTQKPLDIL